MLFDCAPKEFAECLHYIRKLAFEDKPNYNKVRGFFEKVMEQNGWINDKEYDWVIKKRL